MEFKFERKTFNINERLRIGIISDSQLSPVRRKNETTFRNNLVLSLSVLKKQGCNMIIFAGDIGNMASGFAYDTYKAAFKSVFGEKIPIIQSIMGNHDYYGLRTPENCRRLLPKNRLIAVYSLYGKRLSLYRRIARLRKNVRRLQKNFAVPQNRN